MKPRIQLLHLEDNPLDVILVKDTLEADGLHCATTHVQNRAGFLAALERGGCDLILADFSLPDFDGLTALKIARRKFPKIPFILVSGTVGEEVAVESLKSGATDYILKQRLTRLPSAVRRAIKEVEGDSERERLEIQFIHSQKMETVGRLAGGIAHDFNNILSVIIGYSELMMNDLPPDSLAHENAGEIRQAAERATALTRQLLVFCRRQALQPVVLDLNHVVKNMDKMLHHLIGENIVLSVQPAENLGHIKADSGYLGQILMNLVVNARDAMPNGGHLSIKTSNAKYQGPELPKDEKSVDCVLLCVTDTGVGMTDEVKSRLFEAFFTTKPEGKGTGLGLSTCQTMVKQSRGYINVESELGQGTTFKVYFPRVDEALHLADEYTMPKSMPRGTETLLVVEDEPSVRHLACDVLIALGYKVLVAANGQEGLHLAKTHEGDPIRLVLTDVVMPQMNGKDMADWLKTTDPKLKIIFTSGYTDQIIIDPENLDPNVAFLPKPYTPMTLAAKVRDLLDADS